MFAVTVRSAVHSGLLLRFLAALFEHGVFEQLQIHIIADGHHMTGLLRTQKIARTTNFKVAHGDFKARAEFRVFADGVEPLFRDLGQHFPLCGTSDTHRRGGSNGPRGRESGAAAQGPAGQRPQ